MEIPRWQAISREERYFTSVLHHELISNRAPFSELLCSRLGLDAAVTISDVGFEVCFFRDGARAGIIERPDENRKKLEKLTFDFMFVLSDGSAVIVEAKAQQGYDNDQIADLNDARGRIERSDKCPISRTYLVGLCSSAYEMKAETKEKFAVIISWKELAEKYPASKDVFQRANDIYGE
jgi:hypothetical protein